MNTTSQRRQSGLHRSDALDATCPLAALDAIVANRVEHLARRRDHRSEAGVALAASAAIEAPTPPNCSTGTTGATWPPDAPTGPSPSPPARTATAAR